MSDPVSALTDKQIVVGITGSIAAYKSLELIRGLRVRSCQVHPVMTRCAQKFISPMSVEMLAGERAIVDLFENIHSGASHIHLSTLADAVLIAPATANTLGRLASGISDDILCALVMATRSPVLLAPAMNERMWLSPAVQENVRRLELFGYRFVGPEKGSLACGSSGVGRMSEPVRIIECIESILTKKDFAGKRLVVTAGPTREYLDSVRFISNRSSGKMGYAIAGELRCRGAEVVLISGPTNLNHPYGVEFCKVETAKEMRTEVLKVFPDSDGLIMVAAVGDYRPALLMSGKLKKKSHQDIAVRLVPNPDILEEVSSMKGNRLLVGFCAESESLVEHAREKLRRKNLDMIVGNDIEMDGSGFAGDTNKVVVLDRDDNLVRLPLMSKRELARRLCDTISGLLEQPLNE